MKVDLLAVGGGQDRRKPSLDALLRHCPSQTRVGREILCGEGESVHRRRKSVSGHG